MDKSPFKVGDVIEFGKKRKIRARINRILECPVLGFRYHVQTIHKDGSDGITRYIHECVNPVLVKDASNPNDDRKYKDQCQNEKECKNE